MIAITSLMGAIELDLLGGFEVRAADGTLVSLPTQKYRALFAFLATPAGRSHSRDGLIALLWSDLPHDQARAALRQALWTLRRALNTGTATFILDGDRVALDAAAIRVDAAEFVQAASEPDTDSVVRAASLYRGAFLAGLSARETPFEEWMALERERLAELALATLARLLALQRASGRITDAVQTALRLLGMDPLQEAVHRALMQLYVQLGRRSAALRQYQSCVAVLQRELDVEPEAETRALYQDIVRQRSTVPTAESITTSPAPVLETPLIGRDPELAVLREALIDVVAGRGRVVTVVGEAGMGKSRLVAELLADAAQGGARVLFGRAHETDRVLALGPWADALRRARLAEDHGLLGTLHPAWLAEIGRFVPEVSRPGPVATYGAYDYVQLFEGVVGLVTTLAARSAVVIVLEDVHWADDMSLRLASFVARRVDRMPVLFVLTAREEELDAASPFQWILDDLAPGSARELTLESLTRDETLRLVQALHRSRDDATTAERLGARIWAASEGHPFMVVEITRAVGNAPVAEPSASGALPQRVRRLIEHRLQHLSAIAQQLVATAAVIGRGFTYGLLQQAAGVTEETAVGGLEELVRRRIVHAIDERFEFTHDRLRDVAYASLLPPRRMLLHRRIAETLETVSRGDLAEHRVALGAHYVEAEMWERAAEHLYEAAQSAHDRTAYREGISLLERALGAVARLPRAAQTNLLEVDIRLRLFRCLNPLGDPRAAEEVAKARALITESPDDSREATILVEVAELRRFGKDLGGAIEAGDRALVLATKTARPRLVAQAHFQLGVAHVTRGAYDVGIGHLKSTVACLADAPLGDRLGYPYVTALCRLAWSFADLGELDEASRYTAEATRLAEQSEHVPTVAEVSTAIGVLHLAQNRPADAIPPLERARELARTWRIAYIVAFCTSWLGLAYARAGRSVDARTLVNECERERMWDHVRLQWSRIVVRLAEARLLLGDGREARMLADEGLALARSVGEPVGEVEALALLADIANNEAGGARLRHGLSFRSSYGAGAEYGT